MKLTAGDGFRVEVAPSATVESTEMSFSMVVDTMQSLSL